MDGPIMATMRTLLILLPPMFVVLLVVAARNLSALARAQFACLPVVGGSSFRRLSSESKRAISEVLRVAPYSGKRRPSCGGRKEQEEDEAVECVVCLSGIEEGEEIRELKCRHLFHRGCLDRWLARPTVATCPLCRCRLLTSPPAEEACYDGGEEVEEESDMMLFMACVHGRSSWFWPS